MGSLINTPLPAVATGVTTAAATELVIVTSNSVNLDGLENVVLLEWSVDFLNSASGATITFKIERGTAAAGTLVTQAGTWGPFSLTASLRYNFSGVAVDKPGLVGGQQYVVTGTIASNAATSTYETATLTVQSQASS